MNRSPDKPAILAAVVDRYSDELSTQMTGVLTDHLGKTAAMEARIGDLVSAYLRINPPRSRVHDPSTSAWMLVRTVEHLAVQYVLDEPAIERDVFVGELATLVLAYVKPGEATAKTSESEHL